MLSNFLLFDSSVMLVIAGVWGLVIGSFLNVVIYRLPIMIERDFRRECAWLNPSQEATQPEKAGCYNLFMPRSACPHCGHKITAIENIPILSWLFLRGQCRACHAPISIRYPLVEGLTGGLTVFLLWHFGPNEQALAAILFACFLIALIFIDADTTLLPDSLTLPLVWLGLLFNAKVGFVPLQSAVLGAVLGYLLLWSIYWLFKLLTGKEGMGYGDFKLLAALGAWLGWTMIPVIVLISSFSGALCGLLMILLAKRGWGRPMPFGPYLGVAGFICLIWGKEMLSYLYLT